MERGAPIRSAFTARRVVGRPEACRRRLWALIGVVLAQGEAQYDSD
jgi:hypothetical protein